MISRRVWEDLAPKWPAAYWDDWLREPKQRKNRHTIRPEVCRTFHFGSIGVSNSQYSEYLNSIKLNGEFVAFSKIDLSYLEFERWDKEYIASVRNTKEVPISAINTVELSEKEVIPTFPTHPIPPLPSVSNPYAFPLCFCRFALLTAHFPEEKIASNE